MPANKSAFYRYLCIDKCIANRYKPFPSKLEILNYIAATTGQEISARQFENDLFEMKNGESLDFNAPIKYSREKQGYYYGEEGYTIGKFIKFSNDDFDALEFALNILDTYKDVEVFNNFKGALQKISSELSCIKIENELQKPKIIFPEQSSFSKGLEWLSILVKFINERQVLKIKYQRFESEEKIHIISPLILKEYENRWYLVGMNHKRNDVITFGLDRISDVTVSSEEYKTNKFNATEYFNDFIGITKPLKDNKVDLIEIEIENYQANFFKTKHLHHSQKIISETKTHTIFRFNLIINIELIKIIRGFGKDCKVLKPLSLKQQL